MAKPNPLILMMGAGPLATIAGAVWTSRAPFGLRVAGTFGCVALAVMCTAFGIASFFELKKRKREDEAKAVERKRLRERRMRGAEVVSARASQPDSGGRPASADDRSSRAGS